MSRAPKSFIIEAVERRVLLAAMNPSDLLAVGNRLFFLADDGAHGQELWISDGTAAGTKMVRDIRPGTGSAEIRDLTVFGNRVAFNANDGSSGAELWISDGTSVGTFRVTDIRHGGAGSFPFGIEAIGNTLYFGADSGSIGRELWKSDGTAGGTVLVKDIYGGSIGSQPSGFINVNGTIFFSADSATTTGQGQHTTTTFYGRELWKTDGTAAGTVMVKDIRAGFGDSGPSGFVNVNGTLLFTAYTDNFGMEVWRSNGTAAGTVIVEDINPSFRSSNPSGMRTQANNAFFNAIDGDFQQSLWRSDGTASGTEIATSFAPGFTGVFIPSNFVDVGGVSYFAGIGQTLGLELWRTDHTPQGTMFLHQIITPSEFQNNPYIAPTMGRAGNRLFFTALDSVIGLELYVVNGATTTLLRDIFPGDTFEPSPQNFTDVNGKLFFTASDGVHGRELWLSDGTPFGTRPVRESLGQSIKPIPRIAVAAQPDPAVTTGQSSDDDDELLGLLLA